jgi:D-proline reductase (dithiol) PrdB
VGLIARALEEKGIPTVSLSSAYDLTTLVKPPRTFFVNYPLGHTSGKPFDRENQTAILKDALGDARGIATPGAIVSLPYEWGDPFWLAGA